MLQGKKAIVPLWSGEKDIGITFRRLISNTSGYMKPGEEPGKVFNYQTFGMNILTHALAVLYGLYDTDEPGKLPGFGGLIMEKVARPIGADWDYTLTNFDLHERAKIGVFGYYCQVHSNPLDLARVGLLWCRRGNWDGRQVIPERWMRESVRTNPDLIANCLEDERKYGYGFWTNDHGKLWKNLPRSGFTAGGHYVSVFPDHDIVVVQNPGCYRKGEDGNPERGNEAFLELVMDAIH